MNGCAVLSRNKQVAIEGIKNVMESLPIVHKQHTCFKNVPLLIFPPFLQFAAIFFIEFIKYQTRCATETRKIPQEC